MVFDENEASRYLIPFLYDGLPCLMNMSNLVAGFSFERSLIVKRIDCDE